MDLQQASTSRQPAAADGGRRHDSLMQESIARQLLVALLASAGPGTLRLGLGQVRLRGAIDMPDDLASARAKIAAIGPKFDPEVLAATCALCAPLAAEQWRAVALSHH